MELMRSADVHHKVLEMLGSEDYQRMLSSTYGADTKDFRAGAMFGSAISALYITCHADKFNFNAQCTCSGCAFRKSGHPEKSWLPCKETSDRDFCSYAIPVGLIQNTGKEENSDG